MPVVNAPIPTTSKPITQSVVYSIIDKLLETMHLKKPEIMEYNDDTNSKANKGRELVSPGDSRLRFIVNEKSMDGTLGTVGANTREFKPIFNDEELGVQIRPIYSNTEVIINVVYTTKSKNEAVQWYNNHYVNTSILQSQILHKLDMHYGFPYSFVKLAELIHEYRNNIAPYNDTFKDYFIANGSPRLTLASNLKNDHTDWVIAETQGRVLGRFLETPLPEKSSKDSETGVYNVELQYTFTYMKPIAMEMKYPVMVHQQLLPMDYLEHLSKQLQEDEYLSNPSFSRSIGALFNFESGKSMSSQVFRTDRIINIPDFDIFYPIYGHNKITDLVNVLIQIDLDDPTLLLNLNDLGDMSLSSDLLKFLNSTNEFERITRRHESMLHVTATMGDYRIRHDEITCDKDLNIRLVHAPNLRKTYRVRIGVLREVHYWHEKAWDNLKFNPNVLISLAGCINPDIYNHEIIKNIEDKEEISDRDMYRIRTELRVLLAGSYFESRTRRLI